LNGKRHRARSAQCPSEFFIVGRGKQNAVIPMVMMGSNTAAVIETRTATHPLPEAKLSIFC